MKYISYSLRDERSRVRLGLAQDNLVIDLEAARSWAQGALGLSAEPLPASMSELLSQGEGAQDYIRRLSELLNGRDVLHLKGANRAAVGLSMDAVFLYPPILHPVTLRDFYAFESHVRAAFAAREKEVPPEWYQFPVFYFSNPNAIFGPLTIVPYPEYTQALDYELEIACVIGKPGKDIRAEDAMQHVLGFTIMNDWSARDVQRVETRVGLGPAKAKDFATSLGPWLVTPDELADRATERPGAYDLAMLARVNGVERSRGNMKDLHYAFGEMIARASQGAYLYPGDVIGSGTVGSGCLLELTAGQGPWLQRGDIVELEIERLGVLTNMAGERK